MALAHRTAALFLLVLAADRGGAATFSVDMYNDSATATGCLLAVAHDCSLRGALVRANATVASDTILLGKGTYPLAIVGAGEQAGLTGDLDLLEDVVIEGRGAGITVVEARVADRVFDVHPEVDAVLRRLTIARGNEPGVGGGGIRNQGQSLLLERSQVVDSQTGASGGGILSISSALILEASAVSGNHAGGGGGGIRVEGFNSALTVEDSAITGNFAGGWAGGGIAASYTVGVIRNSTLSGNRSTAAQFPIDALALDPGALTLDACTVDSAQYALYVGLDSSLSFRNTLVAGPCAVAIFADVYTLGGNLESPLDTCGFGASDLVDVPDPLLSPLGKYGGSTLTRRPLPARPAVGFLGADPGCLPFDQSRVSRPRAAWGGTPVCDVGAVELAPLELFLDGFEGGTWWGWSGWSH